MSDARLSRREMILVAGATTLVTLTGCDHAASSLLTVPADPPVGAAPSNRALTTIKVSKPTGAAIQAAIDSLGPSGGVVQLIATKPYVIEKTLIINTDNIELIGKGSSVTTLLAKKGAVLTVPYHAEEYLLLVQGASTISILDLKVDTANQANSPGNPRVGIGVWNSTSVTVSNVAFVKNLGPNGLNRSLAFNESQSVTADKCVVSQSRTGIFVWECTGFVLSSCTVNSCEVQPPDYPGPIGAIGITNSTSGSISSCSLNKNTVYGGIFVVNASSLLIDSCKIYKTLPFPTQPGNDGIVIDLCTSQPVTVQGCEIVENSGSGVSAQRSSGVVIKECTIVNSGTPSQGGSGVSINGDTQNVQVIGNHVTDNRGPNYGGIIAGYSSSPDSGGYVSKNVVHGFASGVGLGSNSEKFDIVDNNLRMNTVCVQNGGTGNKIVRNKCS